MNKLELLQALNNDLQVCKANKKESIKTIIKMLSKVKAEIESPYNMGFIAECCIKALFNNDFVKASPKGVNDLNITLSTKQLSVKVVLLEKHTPLHLHTSYTLLHNNM